LREISLGCLGGSCIVVVIWDMLGFDVIALIMEFRDGLDSIVNALAFREHKDLPCYSGIRKFIFLCFD
jgi:hypothetical protein